MPGKRGQAHARAADTGRSRADREDRSGDAARENEGIAGAKLLYAAICFVFCFPFLIYPLLAIWLRHLPARFTTWIGPAMPLVLVALVVAAGIWRHGRISLPNGWEFEGRRLRNLLVAMVLAPLVLSLAWALLEGPFWALIQSNPLLAELLDGY